MTQAPEEKIDILNKLDELLERKFNGEYEESDAASIRKEINEIGPLARQIVIETKCFKLMNIAPPPAIGGAVIQNMDPFDTIFERFYGMSFIPSIRDMLQQSVGVLRAGELIPETQAGGEPHERMVYKQLEMPERVTLGWLVHNVPVSFWFWLVGLLGAAFAFGIQASKWEFVRQIFGVCTCA